MKFNEKALIETSSVGCPAQVERPDGMEWNSTSFTLIFLHYSEFLKASTEHINTLDRFIMTDRPIP
jgi:hypothetical protein